MTQNKQEMKKKFIATLLLGVAIGLLGGILLGMVIQQMIFIAGAVEVAEGLEGTTFNIEVDINETIMVDRMFEYLNETLEEITNE